MRGAKAVFRKEMLDSLRDRRSLLSALLYPLMGPLLFVGLFTYIAQIRGADDPLEIPVIGREHAPELVSFLEQRDVQILPPISDPEGAVREGDVDVVLVISADFAAEFRQGRRAPIELVIDKSRNDARVSIRRTEALLREYAGRLAGLRLLARGVDPSLIAVLDVQENDQATPQKLAANLLNSLPMFVLLAAFIGGMYVATDTTAGERERGSLEPLLINPVSRWSLMLGKWLATTVFGGVSVVLALLFTLLALQRSPLEELGITFDVGALQGLGMLLAALPLAALAAGLQLLVATFARSFKEAQSYLSVLLFVPMVPGMLIGLDPFKTELWMMPIPVLGQLLLVLDVLRGEAPSWIAYALASSSALVLGLLAAWFASRLFASERIVFGR